jgi:hypothetical protein
LKRGNNFALKVRMRFWSREMVRSTLP